VVLAVDPAVELPAVPVLAVVAAPVVALASMKRSLADAVELEPAVVEPDVPVALPIASAAFRQPVTVIVSDAA